MTEKPITFNNPRAIHFCKAPSGKLVGWIEKDNAHYWGSGRTYSDLEKHVKNTLYIAKRMPVIGYFLDSKPVKQEDVPIQFMSKGFKTRAWYGGKEKMMSVIKNEVQTMANTPKPSDSHYDYFDTVMDGQTMIVYGVSRREVARYNMNPANVISDGSPIINKVDCDE